MQKRGFTLIELLVVIAIIAILASILFPIFAKAREQARKAQCTSNVRQIAVAIQMYSQDNGSFLPGMDGSNWVAKIQSYLGNSAQMFFCPSDTTNVGTGTPVSYAFAGTLLAASGAGVKETAITSPTEVVTVADGTSGAGMAGRVLIGGGGLDITQYGAEPALRHNKGAIAGYADGHAKYFGTTGSLNAYDMSNGLARGLYGAVALGMVDNPAAGLAGTLASSVTGTIYVGGEQGCSWLTQVASAVANNPAFSRGFLGENYTLGKPTTETLWLTCRWGVGSYGAASSHAVEPLVMIVAKGCKIPNIASLGVTNSQYACSTAVMRQVYGSAYSANSVRVVVVNSAYSNVTKYAMNVTNVNTFGTDTTIVADHAAAAAEVASDPYAVAFVPATQFDPDRHMAVAPIIAGTTYYLPSASTKTRWVWPATNTTNWPWLMTYKLVATGTQANVALTAIQAGGSLNAAIKDSPRWKWGCWAGGLL